MIKMATGWDSTITKENTNFARLCKLLIDGGTCALRNIFDAKYPPHDLKKHLMDHVNHGILKNLKAKRVLWTEQWDKLYPSVGIPTSESFDITLLTLLLQNICHLPAPVKGWDEEPAAVCVSVEDDVVRLRLYGNKLYGHISEPALSDADFNKYWNDIEGVLSRHGISKTAIDSLKTQSLDPEDESYYIKCLKEWITNESDRVVHAVNESAKRDLEKIESKPDQLSPKQPRPATFEDAEVYSQKLKEAITKQRELQQHGIIDELVKTNDIRHGSLIFYEVDSKQRPEEIQPADIFVNRHEKDRRGFFQSLYEKFRKQRPQEKENPKRILVTGEPGIARTLFSRTLLRDLAKNSISIPDIKFTYLIPFRKLNSLDQDLNLQELLNLSPFLDDATMVDDALMEYFIQHSQQLLIVLEGLEEYKDKEEILVDDEGTNDGKIKKPVAILVRKLLQKEILRDSVIMITSRPDEANEFHRKMHFDRYVEISGLSEFQIIEYAQKYFSTKPEEVRNKAINELFEGSAHYISFGSDPFRCLLMCVFLEWKFKNNTKHENSYPSSLTAFHIQVMNYIERYYNRAILDLDDKAASLAVDKTLDNFAKLAAYLAQQNRFSFTLQDLENLKLTENELLHMKSSSLIFCYPVSSNNLSFQKPICEYSFTHVTIQEFFIAQYLVKKGSIATHRTTDMVYTFMSGLLGLDNNDKLMLELLERLDKHVVHQGEARDSMLRLVSLTCLYEYGKDKCLTRHELTTNRDYRYWGDDGQISVGGITDTDCGAISMLVESTTASMSSPPHLLFIVASKLTCTGLNILLPSFILPNCTVTELHLWHCRLGDQEAQCLSEYLPNTKITRLALSFNGISDVGVKHIMSHLPSSLTSLSLMRNKITDVGVKHILSFLPSNIAYDEVFGVDLEGNDISDKCMKATRQFLRDNRLRVEIDR